MKIYTTGKQAVVYKIHPTRVLEKTCVLSCCGQFANKTPERGVGRL